MTQVGGPAAINGFLYQIIHHIGWLSSVTLKGKLDGQVVDDACLVLEPRNGGDARAEASGIYIVEQYKTRADGTWSLSDMEAVLCDLQKAIPPSFPVNSRYRFVTDGRSGKLDTFKAFLADVKAADGPDDLDNDEKKKISPDIVATNREFFDRINNVTRRGTPQSAVGNRAATFHLLSCFEMEFCVSGSAHEAAIERLLRCYAPDLGDERGIRERLVGVLFEKLSKGETRLDASAIDAIFRDVGLNPDRLHRLAILPETMSELTCRRLAGLKYQPDRDVRAVPEWPAGKPVLLIAGESGVGKTWQLGRLLEALGQQRNFVTLVRAAQTRKDLLNQASQDFWQQGLGETSEKSLRAVSNFLRELEPHKATSGLVVALDDVQDIDLARGLVRQDWTDWGIRLVLTVPTTVARALAVTDSDAVCEYTVGDFSIQELDSLLKRTSRNWAELPSDLKILLRRPILAGLFLELPYSSVQSAPRSEYEIFDRFWQRIAANGRHGDEGVVIALAAHVLAGKLYPLLRPEWPEIGLTEEEAVARLVATGWFRSTKSGEVAFAHDRLLNWAVAKSLVQQFDRGELSDDALGEILASQRGKQDQRAPSRLDYVPMDVLWLLAEDEQNSRMLSRLIARMEDRSEYGSYGETLYVHLLPTLGQRVVPILLERLNEITMGSDGDYWLGFIGKAFTSLMQQENCELKEAIDSLLSESSYDLQNVALKMLTAVPSTEYLDRVWELHQQRLYALEEKKDVSRHSDYQTSFTALRAGIELDPGWLRDRILSADAKKEKFSEFGFLLNALEHPDAPSIWKEAGYALMTKVSANKPRCLLYCIARFADRDKLDFVNRHLSSSEDFTSSAALTALSVLDPPAAIDRLVEVDDAELYVFRNHWLPILLRAQPELTRRRILELAETDPPKLRFIVDLFWERPDEVDGTMLRFILRTLENDFRTHPQGALGGDQLWLYHPLDFLGRITRLELLTILEAEAGGELENMIVAAACNRLHTNSNTRDTILENARRVLILMGGDGIATLIKRELESEHFWVRHGGMNWAAVRADDGIVNRLTAIASRPVPQDADENLKSHFYQEFCQSMTALASLGADTALVEILNNSGLEIVSPDLAQLRAHRGPMSKALTEQTLETLQSEKSSEDLLLTALVIAWLSDDADLIPPVRSVLKQADKEGLVAAISCTTLQALGDTSDDFAQLAHSLLYTKENSKCGLQVLIRMGNQGANLLANCLKSEIPLKQNDLEDLIIAALYDNPATRKLSIDTAVKRCRRGQELRDGPYDIAVEGGDAALREQILDKAFAARSFSTMQPLKAIEGLAKFDVMRAVEAIELAFQFHPKIEWELCKLLVRIAPESAARRLVDAAVSIERKSFRPAVGRALRRLDSGVVSQLLVERMSGLVSERKIAAELAGWLPTSAISDAVGRLAEQDSAIEVKHAALAALERHRRETNVAALLAAFPMATPDRRWSLLVAILEAGDPYLLTDCEDSLWLDNILTNDMPFVYKHHADAVLLQRKKRED